MGTPFGRRTFLGLSISGILNGGPTKPSVSVFPPQRLLDAATELDLYRLTEPQCNAFLPNPALRFVSRRGRLLVCSSDRSGTMQAWRTDWHTGESVQITEARSLDPSSIALAPNDRLAYGFDGPTLFQVNLGNFRRRNVADVEGGWNKAPGFSISGDGTVAAWVEQRGNRTRVQVLRIGQGDVSTAVETDGLISDPQLRPARAQVSYRLRDRVWLANLDGAQTRMLKLDSGAAVGQSRWNPNGRTLLYLSIPSDTKQLITLREHTPDENRDQPVARTSQFVSFGVNGDASVFVGASRSLASPYVLLLLRVAKRELTLCEHRSTDAASVDPVFSPDSQEIFFASDRQGKHAIYRVHVGRFVEETGDSEN